MLSAIAVLAGCAASCPLPGQRRMARTELFFGREMPTGGFVSDAAWADFAATILTPAFPDGFTETAAMGQWRNPSDGKIVREPTRVVDAIGEQPASRLEHVIEVYRTSFHQQSVGIVTSSVCAAF